MLGFFFFLFSPPTSKRSFYGQTQACLFKKKKIPVEKLTSLDLGKATGDPLGEWAVVKAALVSGVSGELKTNEAFSLKGHRRCLVASGHAFEFDGVACSGTLSLTEKSRLVLQL